MRPLYDDGVEQAQEAATRDYVLQAWQGRRRGAGREHLSAARSPPTAGSPRPRLRSLASTCPRLADAVDGRRAARRRFSASGASLRPSPLELQGNCPDCRMPLGKTPCALLRHARPQHRGGSRGPADFDAVSERTSRSAEVRYQMRHEWAVSAEDVLWRRSKLGLRVSEEAAAAA